METKFVIEIEKGETKCEECPFNGCHCATKPLSKLNCNLYNLATMKIKEYNEPNCYDLQCEARMPIPKEYEKEL